MSATQARSPISGEEIYRIALGQGMYTSELASNIPDGFSPQAYNLVATGDSLENRIGIRPPSVDYHKVHTGFPTGWCHYINGIINNDASSPILAWANWDGTTSTMSFIRGAGTGSGDGYLEVTMPDVVTGIAAYGTTMYFTTVGASQAVYKITGINWVADSITYANVPSTPVGGAFGIFGLISFKDRLWGWSSDNLYFTDIAATGGLPETWSLTNFISFRGKQGYSTIVNIVPLSNKLLVFTTAGLFTLLVQGSPGSWILRVLDQTSNTSHPQSMFESKGIVYFVNTNGVWATNGISITKLSGVIEDKFFLAKGHRIHMLNEYEDGMILSIAKTTDTNKLESDSCVNFYTKLEPIAWTEWGIQPPEGETNTFGTNRLCCFISVSKKVPSFLTSDPTVYMLVLVTDSTAASPQDIRLSLLIFDGGENKMRDRVGTLITEPVRVFLKTKYMDANNPYSLKQAKEGMLELFTSDTKHMFSCSWDIDATSAANNAISGRRNFNDFASGRSSNLIRIPAGFIFRRCAFTFASSLQTNTSQIKIKDLALRMDTGRTEFEQVR